MRILIIIAFTCALCDTYAQFLPRQNISSAESAEILTEEDGLTDNTITDILQDSRGFLWIATLSGLNRYDGSQVARYYKSSKKESLPDNWIYRILGMDSLHLLIATKKGLSVMNLETETFRQINLVQSPSDTLFDNYISVMEKDNEGNYWVSSPTVIYQLDANLHVTKAFRTQSNPISQRKQNTYQIIPLPDGKVLFFMETGLFIYTPGNAFLTQVHPEDEFGYLVSAYSYSATLFRNRFLLHQASDALSIYDLSSGKKTYINLPKDKYKVADNCTIRGKGNDWIIVQSNSPSRYKISFDSVRSSFTLAGAPVELLEARFTSFMEDNDGNLWATTARSGMVRVRRGKSPFHNVILQSKTYDQAINPIFRRILNLNGKLVLGATGEGLFQYDISSQSIRRLPMNSAGIHQKEIWNITSSMGDTLWLGTQAGLLWYHTKNNTFGKLKIKAPEGLDRVAITTQFWDSKGILWIGMGLGKGVARYYPQTRTFERDTAIKSFPYRYPLAIAEDSQGNLWFVSDPTANLVRWIRNEKRYEVVHVPDFPGDLYSSNGSIYLDNQSGNLWYDIIAIGLVRYNIRTGKMKVFGLEQGFTGSSIQGIAADNDGIIWLATSNGLSHFNPKSERIETYNRNDGLLSGPYNSVYFDSTSNLIFAGAGNGITWFSPNDLQEKKAPQPVYITGVQVNNEPMAMPFHRFFHLKPSQNNLRISYTAVNLTNGAFNTYQYKLTPGESKWINAGTQKQINLAGLKPDVYTLEIRAARKNTDYTSAGKILRFQIHAPFTSTVWFYLLLTSTGLALIYAWYRYRVMHLRKLERMRMHISQDLHDEIGSRITNIRLMSDIAQRPDNRDPSWLQNIKEESLAIAQRMREIIWNIKPDNDSMKMALPQIVQYISSALEAKNIELTAKMNYEDHKFNLDMNQRHDLLLIIKEGVHNIIKHSNADKANFDVMQQGKRFIIELSDNGRGFINSKTIGNGLESMHHRAEENRWKLEVSSIPDSGTSIRITI